MEFVSRDGSLEVQRLISAYNISRNEDDVTEVECAFVS